MEPLVLETVKRLEEKFGSGTVKVKVEKNTKTGKILLIFPFLIWYLNVCGNKV